jgi:hypothetical protein
MDNKRGGGGGGGPGKGVSQGISGSISAFSDYDAGIGTALFEPVSPYRFAQVFGADLNVPNADGWNVPPSIQDAGKTLFDLSTLTPNHEVVVVRLTLINVDSSINNITFRWYRVRDNTLLYTGSLPIPDPATYGYAYWAWYYGYSYIGYVPWEIYENGDYRCEMWINGGGPGWTAPLYTQVFTVQGIPSTPTGWVKMGNPTERQVSFADIGFDWTKMGAARTLAIAFSDIPFDWTKMGAARTLAVTFIGGSVDWVKMGSPSTLGITSTGGTIAWVKMGSPATTAITHVDVTPPPGGGTPGWLIPVVAIGGAALIGIAAASADKTGKTVGKK